MKHSNSGEKKKDQPGYKNPAEVRNEDKLQDQYKPKERSPRPSERKRRKKIKDKDLGADVGKSKKGPGDPDFQTDDMKMKLTSIISSLQELVASVCNQE